MINTKRKGMHFEQQARQWLQNKGLTLVQQNYSCRYGEVDLIMQQQGSLCFIEVKFRNSSTFGGAAYSIPAAKQKKITRSALHFIGAHKQYQQYPCRFDAVLIQPKSDGSGQHIEWIQNAFDAQEAY